ncbi:MAG: FG-GAP repeat domain-containing protein, partial [Phycisphaerae bacterium]
MPIPKAPGRAGRCFICAVVFGFLAHASQAPGEATGVESQDRRPTQPSPGTQAMVRRLQQLEQQADPAKNLYISDRRVDMIRNELARAQGLTARLSLQITLAKELLVASRPDQAIAILQQVRDTINKNKLEIADRNRRDLRDIEAICYFRLAEVENCIARHGVDSCLFPIKGGGVHVATRGSRGAIKLYTQALEEDSADLSSRWLLNLAYMTLGQYPEQVPDPWLIPPEKFASDSQIPRFYDVAAGLGLDVLGLSGGCVVEDMDADGYLDIIVSGWGLHEQIQYFHNNQDGTFTNRTADAGLTGIVGGLNLCHADYNNDGYPDVLVLRGAWLGEAGKHPNSLLRNNGDGTFDDVTEAARLLSFHPTQTAAWGDFDNDGWVDLFIGNESPAAFTHPSELFRNNGDGTFTECAAQMGIAHRGFVKAVAFGDYNNDGRLDLYVSCRGQPNALYRNDGPQTAPASESRRRQAPAWRFTDVAAQAGVQQPLYSFPTWFWDYDNDGWQDLLVFGYRWRNVGDVAADYLGLPHPAERPRLYH